MAQDDEYIGFKITQRDLDDEFNVNRPMKRQSKNQAIYGVWADSESDDDSKEQKKKSDYSAPIGFVKGGFKDDDTRKHNKSGENVPESKPKNKKQPGASGFAGIRNLASKSSDPGFAQWEMYTNGIGSKLLQKMGYQAGKGLGKNQQGITAPIEAKKRPGFGAIGAYGPEGKAPPLSTPKADQEISEEEESGGQAWKKGQKPQIKKVKVYTKSHDEIITESLLNSWNNTDDKNGPRMKIIDMTGPEQRILSGLSQLHTSRAQKPKDDYHPSQLNISFDVPELKQNLERLIRLSENKITKGSQDYERDLKHVESLVVEKFHLEKQITDEEWQLKQLVQYDVFVQELEDISDNVEHDDDLNAELEMILCKFESFYTGDFKKTFNRLLGLDDLILCTFGPRLRKELLFWKPFSSDDKILRLFKRLTNIVCRQRTFDILLWDYWNPPVCRALQQWPSMKQYEPIVRFLEQWCPVIPKWLYEYITGNHLLPRITREAELWEPSKDPVPIHQWILPWPKVLLDAEVSSADIEFLFEPIYEVIRQKLAKALGPWQPTPEDNSVLKMIALWKEVFSETSFQNFIDQNIVPKLEVMMRAVRVNPQGQSFAEWNWVMTWRPMVSINTMVSLLEKCFFPNWLFTLHNWLSQPIINFAEVQAWYREWKDILTDLATHATIKELLNKALMMMHHRVDPTIGLKHFSMYFNPQVQTAIPEPVQPVPQPPQPYVHVQNETTYSQMDSISFKQMVEMKANENGILFMPIPNRFQAGKQVFQFDKFMVYIDNQVLFLQKYVNVNRIWAPIRLQELIDMCRV